MENTTWDAELREALAEHGETWADIESMTLTDEQRMEPFDPGLGCAEGCAFTVWTDRRIYFPAKYDGHEWVASVSRRPDGKATKHIGGGG